MGMKRKVFLLLPLLGLLCSCGCAGEQSSSSSSSASLSSIVEEPLGALLTAKGTLSLMAKGEENETYVAEMRDFALDFELSETPGTLQDLFLPDYYQTLLAKGTMTFAEFSISRTQGKTTLKNSIASESAIRFYGSEGNVYVDLSDLDFSKLSSDILDSISGRKFYIDQPFAHIDEQAPDYDIPLRGLASKLFSAGNLEKLEAYLDMERHDAETMRIDLTVTEDSLQSLIELFGSNEGNIDILSYLPGLEDSKISFYYDFSAQALRGLDIALGFDLDLGKYVAELKDKIPPFHLRLDAKFTIAGKDGVTLPSLEGYEEFDPNNISIGGDTSSSQVSEA